MSVHKRFGVLIVILCEMATDVMVFVQLLGVIMLSYVLALHGLSPTLDVSDGSQYTAGAALSSPHEEQESNRQLRASRPSTLASSGDRDWMTTTPFVPLWALYGVFELETIEAHAPHSSMLMW